MPTETLLQQGFTFHQQGNYQEAERLYLQILEQEPENSNVLCLLGMVTKGAGKIEEAIAYYQKAIALKPDFIEARFNLGNALSAIAKIDEAITCYQTLLELEPNHAGAYSNLGLLYHQQKKIDQAQNAYQQALILDPNRVEALYNLGNLFKNQNQLEQAISYYQQALNIQPNFPEALLNLGKSWQQQGNVTEAIAHYRRALQVNPNYADAYYTLGNALMEQGRIPEAILDYYHCLQINPQEAYAHTGLAFALLAQGNLKQGFTEYEWRYQTQEFPPRHFSQPQWDGSPLNNQTLYLHTEQGFGDTIQMIRYLPWVRQQGAKIILECREPLKRLFAPLPEIERIVTPGETIPPCDYQISLMSLPHLSQTTLTKIPAPLPLSLPARTEAFQLNSNSSDFKVGLVWQGHPEHPNHHLRSCPLPEFIPILDSPGIEFYSLQKEITEEDILLLNNTKIHPFPSHCQDFLDTAQIIDRLDLIITIDTAIAHLSATLGKPTWVLLHLSSDWRWMLVRLDSPWYPSIRLFRQSQPRDWSTVISQVKQALQELRIEPRTD